MTIDLRPVAHIIGLLLTAFGAAMLFPAMLDLAAGDGNWRSFLLASAVTSATGGAVAMASANAMGRSLDVRQAYALTIGTWVTLSVFGAMPFYLGAPDLALTDAIFESVSGITTTGSTVIVGLDSLPPGMNLWRGMLNWIGGLGIAFVAMIFLPVMRVGGMQFFKAQGFETFGKSMPRAADIARALLNAYAGLTLLCIGAYSMIGMTPLDAVVMGAASIATGGFAPTDISFGKYPGAGEYLGALFMLLGAMPYLRYVQLVNGQPRALLFDRQVRAFVIWLAFAVGAVVLWRMVTSGAALEPTVRETLFNLTSVMTGTGFFSGSFTGWGPFVIFVVFILGLIGGCSGSSSGALSVFRVLVLIEAIGRAVRRIAAPDRIMPLRYDGRTVGQDAVQGLMLYVNGYLLAIGVMSVALTLTGVDAVSAIFAVWTSIGNIGYGYGDLLAPTGTFVAFPEAAKWLLILTMLMGRLGLLALFVVVLPRFWRA